MYYRHNQYNKYGLDHRLQRSDVVQLCRDGTRGKRENGEELQWEWNSTKNPAPKWRPYFIYIRGTNDAKD